MASAAQSVAQVLARRRQRERRDIRAFQPLRLANHEFAALAASGSSAELVMPANAQVVFRGSAAITEGALSVHLGDDIVTPSGGGYTQPVWVEKGESLHAERSAGELDGTGSFYVLDAFGEPKRIATMEFTSGGGGGPGPFDRITEDGQPRITEDGQTRETEDAP